MTNDHTSLTETTGAATTAESRADVAIIGGGAAGLSAAVALSRSLRSVVVIDAGEPRNAPSPGVHNLLGREGISPRDLIAQGRAEAEGYGTRMLSDSVTHARRDGGDVVLELAGGGELRARRILLATGLHDELPDVPGVADLWGTRVLHCPYCHGWEVRGQRIGVLGTTSMAVHQVMLFRQLSEHITLFTHTMPELSDDDWDTLAALGVEVVSGRVAELRAKGGEIDAVVLEGGHEFAIDALTVAPRFVANSDIYEQLGGTLSENPMGSFVETDFAGKTDLDGVWAAGNVSELGAVVAAAAAQGTMAGGAINGDLVMAEARAAVAARAA
ncbi:NAD(P)/FAD-dependent oxidoreductase [Microbacterium sp. MPKO10]|uniref:NAD(P)/FAD-dependent oxidoreductase n=1 Tax=Microbacterium sp. MPKO10 TaxID=2989818 RepID=UPI0022363A0A|nr:NAD(P)/FAD-dependent oxidoreductase [Microbacterium sp. MPKO10]MCW4457266.1 NAD(P)/FAD-dependent oxidoreductase [Microbacterium sp. MPKO10]